MVYFLGRDVTVNLSTEDGETLGTSKFVHINTGTAAISYSSATSGTSGANVDWAFPLLSGALGATVGDLTGVDLSIGAVDEDITYFGMRSVTKAEIKKETTVTLTRKKIGNAWEVVYNDLRYGISGSTPFDGLQEPTVKAGYRLFITLKSGVEVFTVPNCCVQSHTVSINADGSTEETLEFMGYVDPVVSSSAYLTTTSTSGL